jgi:hypothetical protein
MLETKNASQQIMHPKIFPPFECCEQVSRENHNWIENELQLVSMEETKLHHLFLDDLLSYFQIEKKKITAAKGIHSLTLFLILGEKDTQRHLR